MIDMRGRSMLVVGLGFVVALLSGNGLVSAQSYCTKSTCPPGPVVLQFEFANCTGAVTYLPAPIAAVCHNSTSSTSIEYKITSDYFATVFWLNDGNCGASGSQHYMSATVYFGVCSSLFLIGGRRNPLFGEMSHFGSAVTASAGSMILGNVNATYDSPQSVSTLPPNTYPTYEENSVECYSPNNCTDEGHDAFIWFTSHSNDTCLLPTESGMYTGLTAGACYEHDGAYLRPHCLNGHAYVQDIMVGNGCERVAQSNTLSYECGPGSSTNIHCIAPPLITPSTPSAPVSQSPNTLATASIIFAAITPFFTLISL